MPGYFMRRLANLYNSHTVHDTDGETEAQKDSRIIILGYLSVAGLRLEIKAGWCLGL